MSVKLREKKLKDGRISLYLAIYENGKYNYDFLNLYLSGKRNNPDDKEIRKKAELLRAKTEVKLQSGDGVVVKKKATDTVCLFSYLELCINRRSHKSDLKSLRNKLMEFTGNYPAEKISSLLDLELSPNQDTKSIQLVQPISPFPMGKLNTAFLISFQEYLLNRGDMQSNGVFNLMKKLNTTLNEAKAERLIDKNPNWDFPKHLRLRYQEQPINSLLPDDIRLLLEHKSSIPQEVANSFLVALFTALRWSDVSVLRKDQIRVAIIGGERRKILAIQIKKTKTVTHLPLSKEAVHFLACQLNEERRIINECRKNSKPYQISDFIFPRYNRMKPASAYIFMRKKLKIWLKASGINKRLNFHLSRHTFATMLLPLVKDIRVVQKLMQHRSIKTTLRYAFVLDSYQAASVDTFGQHNFLNR